MAGTDLPLPNRIAKNINLIFRLPSFILAALSFRTQQIMLGTTITKILVRQLSAGQSDRCKYSPPGRDTPSRAGACCSHRAAPGA